MTATAFRPPPGFANSHVQTVLGQVLGGVRFLGPSRERFVRLPDGDILVLHDSVPPGWRRDGRVVLLVHGLGGSAASPQLGRVGRRVLASGFRVVRMDMRGAGRGAFLARRTYHGGKSDDVRAAAEEIRRDAPDCRVVLVGFSLGGNVVLKLAGEADDEPVAGLERVAAVGPPIDLSRCAALLHHPKNRFYERYFTTRLVGQVRARWRALPDLPRVPFPARMTLRLFDELYVAPTGGFADAADYYRRSSSLPLIPQIGVPTLILTARDDPFIAVEPFEEVKAPGHVRILIERHGGHLGFKFGDAPRGLTWADELLIRWVLDQ